MFPDSPTPTPPQQDNPGPAPEMAGRPYSESEWENESYALLIERADPIPCPNCGRTGFFGPRALDPGRKLRACRFCGFSQEVGQAPIRLRPVVHTCADWPQIAKAPYLWWVMPGDKFFQCPWCTQQVTVAAPNAFVKGALVKAPADDPEHPWWRVPQGRPYTFYYKFWENWKATKGRVVL